MKKILWLSTGILLTCSSVMADGHPKKSRLTSKCSVTFLREEPNALLQNNFQNRFENVKERKVAAPQPEIKPNVEKNEVKNRITENFKSQFETFKPRPNNRGLSIKNFKTMYRLDSIVDIDDPTGFEIQKTLFSYNDLGWPTKLTHFEHGYLFEEITLEWIETHGSSYGWMKSFVHVNHSWMDARKQLFSYHPTENIDTVRDYRYDWNTESWYLYDLYIFKYNIENNVNVVSSYVWRMVNGEMIHILREYATYDNLDRQLSYEAYFKQAQEEWDDELGDFVVHWGTEWLGQNREEKVYWTGSNSIDFLTFLQGWHWDETEKDWIPFRRATHEFNERGQFTTQLIEDWNAEEQDWVGGNDEWNFNGRTTRTFDSEFKQTSEIVERFAEGEWELRAKVEFTWEKINNEWNMLEEVFFHFDDVGITIPNGILSQRYITIFSEHFPDVNLREMVYEFAESLSWDGSGDWVGQYERFQTYNNAGQVTEIKHYVFNFEGNRVSAQWNKFTYDAANELIEEERWNGDWATEDGWTLRETLFYTNENGVRIGQLSYFREDMLPGHGFEIDYNFSVPFADLLIWQNVYSDPLGEGLLRYQTNTVVFSFANWDGWGDQTEFLTNTWTYYWTPIQVDASNQDVIVAETKNAAVSVYPNPVRDVLFIETEQTIQSVFVFDMNGRMSKHIRGNQNSINLQSLPSGNYVVRIHTDGAIVPVRIVKQ